MENKFEKDDFEQFLKDSADDFRMYPSKRVWNSLYNNLHPGRKWPSLTVCLLLVSSIIFIGVAHKNEITGSQHIAQKQQQIPVLRAAETTLNSGTAAPMLSANVSENQPLSPAGLRASAVANSFDENVLKTPVSKTASQNQRREVADNDDFGNAIANRPHTTKNARTALQVTGGGIGNNESSVDIAASDAVLKRNNISVNSLEGREIPVIGIVNNNKPAVTMPALKIATKNNRQEEKEWMEDFAFHNKPAPKAKSRLSYRFYLTPSVGYRTLERNLNYEIPALRSLVAMRPSTAPELKNSVTQGAAFNLEAGYNLIYAFSKSIRFKTGLQFNHTNYRLYAHNLGHFTSTSVLLHDPSGHDGVAFMDKSTTLANLPGEASDKKLNSSTFQVSIPLGAEIKIAGKNNIQWFVGGTIQPTYVLFGNAYLISSDLKNYVYDSKFLRKFNMNAAVETFISFKWKHGITYNAGPQLRYQLLSTYDKRYSYTEKLYNLGVKIGLTRNF